MFTMNDLTNARHCMSCGRPLRGRIDKKFCDDACRNTYNNQQKLQNQSNGFVRTINSALLKNRKILQGLVNNSGDIAKATREKLLGLGFQFKYHTHLYVTKSGKTYTYCYDYGYLPIENDWYLVVKRKQPEKPFAGGSGDLQNPEFRGSPAKNYQEPST